MTFEGKRLMREWYIVNLLHPCTKFQKNRYRSEHPDVAGMKAFLSNEYEIPEEEVILYLCDGKIVNKNTDLSGRGSKISDPVFFSALNYKKYSTVSDVGYDNDTFAPKDFDTLIKEFRTANWRPGEKHVIKIYYEQMESWVRKSIALCILQYDGCVAVKTAYRNKCKSMYKEFLSKCKIYLCIRDEYIQNMRCTLDGIDFLEGIDADDKFELMERIKFLQFLDKVGNLAILKRKTRKLIELAMFFDKNFVRMLKCQVTAPRSGLGTDIKLRVLHDSLKNIQHYGEELDRQIKGHIIGGIKYKSFTNINKGSKHNSAIRLKRLEQQHNRLSTRAGTLYVMKHDMCKKISEFVQSATEEKPRFFLMVEYYSKLLTRMLEHAEKAKFAAANMKIAIERSEAYYDNKVFEMMAGELAIAFE